MDKLIEMLNKIPPYIIVIYLAIFLTLEHFWPHSKDRKYRIRHLINNAGLLIISTAINFFISFILIAWVEYVEENNIDLLITIPKKHKLLDSLFKHSSTKQLVTQSHVPVMCVHE